MSLRFRWSDLASVLPCTLSDNTDALHAFIPCATRDQAESLLDQFASPKIDLYIRYGHGRHLQLRPTGRIRRFLKFLKQDDALPSNLPRFAASVSLLRLKLGLESVIKKID